MVNRLIAYRVAQEHEHRLRPRLASRGGHGLRAAEVAARLTNCLVQVERNGHVNVLVDDYELAAEAGVSARQTGELYEESGAGPFVRDVLNTLAARGLVTIEHRSATGRYRGIRATPKAHEAPSARPWYQRLVAFFDPPEQGRATRT